MRAPRARADATVGSSSLTAQATLSAPPAAFARARARSILEAAPDVGSTLPTLLPTIAARVGAVPYAETCEEVRLQLVELARLVVRRGGTACAPHTKELAGISASLAADAFPDVKRDVCALARELAAALPTQIGVHCAPLAKALAANLAHAHSKVRAVTLDAMCVLLLREDSALPELAERLVALAADHTPSVREQCARQLGELLVSLPDPAPHTVRLLPVLLHALSDEVASVRETALGALRRAGERAGPGADGDRAGVAHAAPQTPPPRAELPPPFDAPPPWGAVQLAQAELAELLAATVAQLRDWTAAKRLRGACTLLGLLWLARGAMTEQLDALLGALYAAADDDDAAVRAKVAACARMAGTQCDVAVALGLAARHCERSDSAPLAHRSACLLTLANLLTGVGGEAVGPHVRALARTLCRPQFCAGPAVSRGAAGAADDAGAAAYAQLRVRLADVVASLVEAAPAACAEDPQGFQLYATLVQLAAVPSAADDDYAPQRRALSVLDARLAPACGLDGAGALHARHGGRLLEQLVAGGLAPDDELAERLDAPDAPAGSAGKKGGSQLVVELGGTRAAPGARAAPNGGAAGAERASGADPPYSAWTVSTHEWHVLQTLLQHAPGEWAASQLLGAFPVLAALLEPSREPALRLTALTVVQRLLADPAFCAHDGLREWAALLMQALLIPNLVWRAGRAAQQVRLGAALCLRALVQLEPAVLTASELTEAMPVRARPDARPGTRRLAPRTRPRVCARTDERVPPPRDPAACFVRRPSRCCARRSRTTAPSRGSRCARSSSASSRSSARASRTTRCAACTLTCSSGWTTPTTRCASPSARRSRRCSGAPCTTSTCARCAPARESPAPPRGVRPGRPCSPCPASGRARALDSDPDAGRRQPGRVQPELPCARRARPPRRLQPRDPGGRDGCAARGLAAGSCQGLLRNHGCA